MQVERKHKALDQSSQAKPMSIVAVSAIIIEPDKESLIVTGRN
jgi:hypothetical protein